MNESVLVSNSLRGFFLFALIIVFVVVLREFTYIFVSNKKDTSMEIEKDFDKQVAINVMLYILKQLGGMANMHKLFKILYFAEQRHLSIYGKRIVGDDFIAMQFGPVPSRIYDMFKAIRGDSFFSDEGEVYRRYITSQNKYVFQVNADIDDDYISESARECLDCSIRKYKDMNFSQLTEVSHGLAYQHTTLNREISFADIMREIDETEDYAKYIQDKIRLEESSC